MNDMALYFIAIFQFLRLTLIILWNPEEIYLSNANENITSKNYTFTVLTWNCESLILQTSNLCQENIISESVLADGIFLFNAVP
jgi:hypothetical protein